MEVIISYCFTFDTFNEIAYISVVESYLLEATLSLPLLINLDSIVSMLPEEV